MSYTIDLGDTKERRLSGMVIEDKPCGVMCPVCFKGFSNRYALSNHFMVRGYSDGPRFIDDAHRDFWIEEKKKKSVEHAAEVASKHYEKRCWRCGGMFQSDFTHRFAKQCPSCKEKYPSKIKRPQSETKEYPCARCHITFLVKRSASNTVCPTCRKKEREEKVAKILAAPMHVSCLHCGAEILYYRKHLRDKLSRAVCPTCQENITRYKNHPKYERVIALLENTLLTRRDIKEVLGLELDFVREVAIDRFGASWYKRRIEFIRRRAHLQICFVRPSGLEKTFVKGLQIKPCAQNDWMILTINGKQCKKEIDVKVALGETGRKFAILIDGETFHGKNSYFRQGYEKIDIDTATTLASMGYFTIRYSETEVNSGWACDHFKSLYDRFLANPPVYYCRNWMTKEEIVR